MYNKKEYGCITKWNAKGTHHKEMLISFKHTESLVRFFPSASAGIKSKFLLQAFPHNLSVTQIMRLLFRNIV